MRASRTVEAREIDGALSQQSVAFVAFSGRGDRINTISSFLRLVAGHAAAKQAELQIVLRFVGAPLDTSQRMSLTTRAIGHRRVGAVQPIEDAAETIVAREIRVVKVCKAQRQLAMSRERKAVAACTVEVGLIINERRPRKSVSAVMRLQAREISACAVVAPVCRL